LTYAWVRHWVLEKIQRAKDKSEEMHNKLIHDSLLSSAEKLLDISTKDSLYPSRPRESLPLSSNPPFLTIQAFPLLIGISNFSINSFSPSCSATMLILAYRSFSPYKTVLSSAGYAGLGTRVVILTARRGYAPFRSVGANVTGAKGNWVCNGGKDGYLRSSQLESEIPSRGDLRLA
jgi:hypothetical protein